MIIVDQMPGGGMEFPRSANSLVWPCNPTIDVASGAVRNGSGVTAGSNRLGAKGSYCHRLHRAADIEMRNALLISAPHFRLYRELSIRSECDSQRILGRIEGALQELVVHR